ncbi:flagellar motor switch protein FliM [Hathewaya proteolytica DSM 3090]|uniref:Flagellar motor switch protein FliM n=1 Tax=Hathewaya proteolytica DSM 3090 TaxID=1121331 RepID=A0A1M6LC41_9CLOT|nr:flagellar motor switch protein FliM [Hathewaya proteolytica]SHJ68767.1 flagellar motor switch protein FliM [Hathewaya proteolytica DSM 3090]
MADVLSQGEIDALLSALSSGELEPENLHEEEQHKVKKYDFRSPQKFSKEHLRTLELIYNNYSRIISTYLTAQVRNNIKVKIETIQQITYEEFIHSVPNPTVLTLFSMQPLLGSLIFETNPDFVFKIIDVLLGGKGDRKIKARELSDIDKNIIWRINKGLIENMKLAWEDILDVEPEMESLETNPALNQTLAPNEPVALITFTVDMGRSSTFLNICIPFLSIEKVLGKLEVQYLFKGSNIQDETREEDSLNLRNKLDHVAVEVVALLGKTQITIEDFLRLSPGDVMTLNNKVDEPVSIYIDDKPYYYAKPGVIGKFQGLEILDIIDKDVENYE